ncbi:MAG: hypothetical protein AAF485_21245, partial [Chloroflexota bacterium]
WQSSKDRGLKLLFAGPPEQGSYAAANVLLNASKFTKRLGTLDLRHTSQLFSDIFAEFPSMIETLPKTQKQDLFDPAFWQSSPRQLDADRLTKARQLREDLAQAIKPQDITYIYGHYHQTVTEIQLDGPRVRQKTTVLGEGNAWWPEEKTTADQNVYYCTLPGNRVLSAPKMQPALKELICEGATALLPNHQPVAR